MLKGINMNKFTLYKFSLVLLSIALTSGCSNLTVLKQSSLKPPGPVPDLVPGIMIGYLPMEQVPNGLTFLTKPPAENSLAFELDQQLNQYHLSQNGTRRWKLATMDDDLVFPNAAGIFSCTLNAPVNKQDTPHLYRLLRRSATDAGLSTYPAKHHYNRFRPFMLNKQPTCSPDSEERLRSSGSFPSGHTSIGWAWALILSEISPQQNKAILARGWEFGQSRMVCNLHWQSDVTAGRIMAAATVARLHAEPLFVEAVELAKKELKTVRAKGLAPNRDCKEEFDMLQPVEPKVAIKK
jgi:acid phosphatase (class A)